MPLNFTLKLTRKTIAVSGIGALVIMLALLSLPSFFAISLDPARAEKEIRHYLRMQMASRQMEEMEATGLRSPDAAMAERLQAGFKHIDGLEFVSVEIRHFLFVPPFTSYRMYTVKVVTRDADRHEQTRYFTLSARSKFFDVFWVAEHSRPIWFLSC
jgi:hypothetical protein